MSPMLSVHAYQSALRTHVREGGEERTLLSAYELGRQLMDEGVGLLDVVRLHAESVRGLEATGDLAVPDPGESARRADGFLAEVLAPFEMAYLGFREANTVLQRLTADLEEEVAERTGELKDSLSRLQAAEAEQRRLLGRAVAAEEQERQRLADDLHDDTIQAMTTVALRLAGLRSRTGAADPALLDRLEHSVGDAIDRLRRLVFDLRPPALDRDGLATAIHTYMRTAMDDGPEVELEDLLDEQPPRQAAEAAFRVVQEALTNVRKHAAARRVRVSLAHDGDDLAVTVLDDGHGFDPRELDRPRPGHVGTLSMRERAAVVGGRCTIDSREGGGTTVVLRVPWRRGEPGS